MDSSDAANVPVPARPADLGVSDRTRERIEAATPENTKRAYGRQLRRFDDWCDAHGRTAYPCTAETFAEFVSHLCDLNLGTATISLAMAAIRTQHRNRSLPVPDTTGARLVLRTHRRELADTGARYAEQAPPITLDALRKMIAATPADTLIGLRDRALLVLGFALMSRRSELSALHISDVTETDDGLMVLIRSSKTDQDAHGATVAIPRGVHPATDPVRVLRAYLNALAEGGITDGRLIRSVNRWGHVGVGITEDGVNKVVRAAAIRAELPNAPNYSAHSLRAGGATAAYRAGAPISTITRHGRWADGSATVQRYIRAVDQWSDNPMRGIL